MEGIAGLYEGLPPLLVLPPSAHFLGRPNASYTYGAGKTGLSEYGRSGVPGEFALTARVELDEQTVSWKGLEKFSTLMQRSDMDSWVYPEVSFQFDRLQYENALIAAKVSAYA